MRELLKSRLSFSISNKSEFISREEQLDLFVKYEISIYVIIVVTMILLVVIGKVAGPHDPIVILMPALVLFAFLAIVVVIILGYSKRKK